MAATREGEVVHEALLGLSEKGGPQHATALLGEVERAVAAAGGWERIERIAVGVGPGSFTGLRVGIATARGLARSSGAELVGVGTLEALARGAGPRPQRPVLAVLDARRGEVFSLLRGPGEATWEALVESPEELAARLRGLAPAPLCVGSGAVRFRRELADTGAEVPADGDPIHRVAADRICELATVAPVAPEPIYLRPPDAERWRERDTVKTTG